jgi:hypothetical protein
VCGRKTRQVAVKMCPHFGLICSHLTYIVSWGRSVYSCWKWRSTRLPMIHWLQFGSAFQTIMPCDLVCESRRLEVILSRFSETAWSGQVVAVWPIKCLSFLLIFSNFVYEIFCGILGVGLVNSVYGTMHFKPRLPIFSFGKVFRPNMVVDQALDS